MMKFIDPVTITDAILISSTRAETDHAAYNSGTTYTLAAHCISTTTHRIYESMQAGNLNHNPTTDDGTWWIDIGPTNRWAMFDQKAGSVTSQATPLTVVLDPGIVTSLALLDVAATRVDVSMTDGAGGATVYDESYDMGDTAPIKDWWDFFFAPIIPRTTLIVDDLPPYSAGRLTVAIVAATTAACGTLAVGTPVEIGKVRASPQIGIIDYSGKITDTWGITSIVERDYAKRIEVDLVTSNDYLDYVAQQLAGVRARPVVWVADDSRDSLVVYGWVRDWGITIAYLTVFESRLTIEGLV
ncbi:MAG: hypothetical protein NTX56_02800 [Proteobacteria bacterium]|nr:hypothetical protein [Pseudomonadota bacterium]